MTNKTENAETRIALIDTLRGILLELSDYTNQPQEQKIETYNNISDIVNHMLDVIELEIETYNPKTEKATITITIPK